MAIQITDDGACIRIENGTKAFLVVKEQIKTIDTIHDNIVRIDIGEGPLNSINVDYREMISPVVSSANELRDVFRDMLLIASNGNNSQAGQSVNQLLQEVQTLRNIVVDIFQLLYRPDYTKLEPILIDESNPNIVYKGWTESYADGSRSAWVIKRTSRVNDITIHEWVDGKQYYTNIWDNRALLNYSPYLINPPHQ